MNVKDMAYEALYCAFRSLKPDAAMDSEKCKPYVGRLENNLLEGVFRRDFESDLSRGGGNELAEKFRAVAVHSSAALVVNSFATFKRNQEEISHALRPAVGDDWPEGEKPLRRFRFERKYRAWPGNTPANLDLVAEGGEYVLAVESKLTEHVSRGRKTFRKLAEYARNIRDDRCSGQWFQAMEKFNGQFSHLDFAQLVKHALALACELKDRNVTLLYLYWEPQNWRESDVFETHRREVACFSNFVKGGFPRFRAMSYRDLWDAWEKLAEPAWLKDHCARLRARYDVRL